MFEPMIRDTDLVPNADGRWVMTNTEGHTFLMAGPVVAEVLPGPDTFPTQVRMAVRDWVDLGMTRTSTQPKPWPCR